jgi:hypothetical protein
VGRGLGAAVVAGNRGNGEGSSHVMEEEEAATNWRMRRRRWP